MNLRKLSLVLLLSLGAHVYAMDLTVSTIDRTLTALQAEQAALNEALAKKIEERDAAREKQATKTTISDFLRTIKKVKQSNKLYKKSLAQKKVAKNALSATLSILLTQSLDAELQRTAFYDQDGKELEQYHPIKNAYAMYCESVEKAAKTQEFAALQEQLQALKMLAPEIQKIQKEEKAHLKQVVKKSSWFSWVK